MAQKRFLARLTASGQPHNASTPYRFLKRVSRNFHTDLPLEFPFCCLIYTLIVTNLPDSDALPTYTSNRNEQQQLGHK